VDDLVLVDVVQGPRDVGQPRENLRGREPATRRVDPVLEASAVEVGQDDVGNIPLRSPVEHPDDVRVGELDLAPHLALEASAEAGVVEEARLRHLDDDTALHPRVEGQIDGAHPTATQLRLDAVAAVERPPDPSLGRRVSHTHAPSPDSGLPRSGKS
jgi:hypothetical protein